MLLLESLRSKQLWCKLLKHMLDYACTVKTPLPASLGLLLHYMRNCNLLQDPAVKSHTGVARSPSLNPAVVISDHRASFFFF